MLLLPILCLPSCNQSKGILFRSNVGNDDYYTLYDDSYFLLDNSKCRIEIALPSFASAMTTIRSDCDYENRSGFLLDLWEKEGFSSFYISDSFKEKPGLDSIGFAFASKEISSKGGPIRLIAITIRSGTYEGEWANNITIGPEGSKTGMALSALSVYQGLQDYIKRENYSGKVKFWLSGYSRGAGVANYLSGTLVDALEEDSFLPQIQSKKEDVYAYCFEPISCVLEGERNEDLSRYQGIKNIMNFNDVMPHVIPKQWGFTRFGEDWYFPDRLTDIRFTYGVRKNLLSHYKYDDAGYRFTPYTLDEWQFFDVGEKEAEKYNLPRESLFPSPGRLARSIPQELAKKMTRSFYAGLVEPGFRNLIATLMGLNADVGENPISPSLFLNILTSYPFVRNLLLELQQGESGAFAMDASLLLYEVFNANEQNVKAVKKLSDENLMLFYMISVIFRDRKDLSLQLFFRDNITKFFQSHYTQLNYSFTRSCDKRIYGNSACELNDGSYYLFHIDKAEEIVLKETRYGEIFSFREGKMRSSTLSAERLNDGSIDIYLPKNGVYSYHCLASSLSLSEVDGWGEVSLLKEGMPFSGQIAD